MRAATSPSTSSSEDTDDEEETSSADPVSPIPPSSPVEIAVLPTSSTFPQDRSGEQLSAESPAFGRGNRVMRTVMVVEFKVVEVTHISIRTQRPRPANGQLQSSQDCTTDEESEAIDEAEAIETKLSQAIQSLDSLNDQIVQFIFSPGSLASSCDHQLPSLSSPQYITSTPSPSSSSAVFGSLRLEGGAPPGDCTTSSATCSTALDVPEGDERAPVSLGSRDSPAASTSTSEEAAADDLVRESLLPLRHSSAFLPQNQEEQRESLKSSMALMRRLLVDAQSKFRRMMEENKALASRIDGDIQTAHQEVSMLRAELADTNKRITQITNSVSVTDKPSNSNGSSKASLVEIQDSPTNKMKAQQVGSASPSADRESDSRSLDGHSPGVKSMNGTNGSLTDRTKTPTPTMVEPLKKKPPLKSATVKQGLASKRGSPSSSKVSDGVSRVKESSTPDVTNRSSSTESCGADDEAAAGAINLMTGKSQDADDEGANADCDRCRKNSHRESGSVPLEDKLYNLEEQNDQLNERIGSLQKELDGMQRISRAVCDHANGQESSYTIDRDLEAAGSSGQTSSVDLPTTFASSSSSSSVTLKNSEVDRLETELKHAKDALAALKADRKRLKAEKFDLLNQMKQLYGTLEDKEKELRDFIRNYEQRMRESDDNLKQLVREREDSEREKWNILKHARDEAERSVALCAQLGIKEAQVKQLQDELICIREKLGYMSDMDIRGSSCRSNGYRSPSATSMHTQNGRESSNTPTPTLGGSEPTSSYDGTPTITVDRDSGCSPGHHSIHTHHRSGSKDLHRPSLTGLSRSAEEIYNSSGSSDTGISKKNTRRKSRESKNSDGRSGSGGTWGSISRVFSRSRQRKSLDPGFYEASGSDQQRSSWSPQSSLCASPLTEDSYTEKLKLLEEAQGQRMDRWKAGTVLAWIEITLGMPQYGSMCAENIKSGKILLELSDAELEAGLGIANSMHRRKLRLAIEEHRDPTMNPYPKISHLTHTWVVEEWLPSLGLLCYADNFARQLIDGRVLETLSKKDLEKSLGVSRKFHQVSIMHAIQLLRMVKFDKQLLQQRRSHSESMDVDPLVWTNQRFIKWAKSIDLVEYADNLRDSGVHGALVVLEPSFQADTMATALGIPASKNIIRRHLTTELESLVQPARMSLEAEALVNSKRGDKKSTSSLHSSSSGSLGRNFLRSSSSKGTLDRSDNKRRSSMRFAAWKSSQGSLTRALGLKLEDEFSHQGQTYITNQRHNSTPELTKKSITAEDIPTGSARSRENFSQRRSLSASRVKLGSQGQNSNAGYMETMTVTPV